MTDSDNNNVVPLFEDDKPKTDDIEAMILKCLEASVLKCFIELPMETFTMTGITLCPEYVKGLSEHVAEIILTDYMEAQDED